MIGPVLVGWGHTRFGRLEGVSAQLLELCGRVRVSVREPRHQ